MCKAIVFEDRNSCTYGMVEVVEVNVDETMLPVIKHDSMFNDSDLCNVRNRTWKAYRTHQYLTPAFSVKGLLGHLVAVAAAS